ncbi:kynureninase-like isoform X2 [Portunus trituberculatus]|uniref:kynureninase-like isoform X2 n=1 Tax=Portunus trituberculatus TaxID=210409 RepID=UPI001E1CFF09|nr:kynureninase-like isoform X2 [Portunus trituberculatus]
MDIFQQQQQQSASPKEVLESMAAKQGLDLLGRAFADHLDNIDPLKGMRDRFLFPRVADQMHVEGIQAEGECIYLCGNSLGLQPKTTKDKVVEVLDAWAKLAINSHFHGPLPAAYCDNYGKEVLGELVGADPSQVVLMNALTVNLHLLLLAFYQPTETRYKILIEGHAFPSDRYAVASQMRLKGLDPEEAMLQVRPRPGEHTIRTEDILQLLKEKGPSIAVVCLSGVQYYTGQKFDMERVTKAAQEQGCVVGWDLAHAVGNVELKLDEWGVDFACWCTYKYLNSGAGCLGGSYVNARHNERSQPRLQGWWSNRKETRFEMREYCDRDSTVDGFRISNPPPLLVGCVLASLELFREAGLTHLLQKQFLLTGYLELLIKHYFGRGDSDSPAVTIITPEDTSQRGCQLSLIFSSPLKQVHKEITKRGIMCDIRQPNVMRIAPAPLYNSFCDIHQFVTILGNVFALCKIEAA